MLRSPRKITIVLYILAAIAILSFTSVTLTLAQTSNTTTATIVGQANINGVATNGVTVNIGSKSATTSSYNGVDGVYVITGLPTGTSLPLSATYQGQTYTDTIDPLTAGQQYYEIPAFNIATSPVTATPTAAPNATVTPTPSANATVTPTPSANATVTPTPAANATATPTPAANASATPTPTATPEATAAPTPAPAAPAQTTGESSPPPAAPEPVPAQITPAPTDIVDQMRVKDPTATVNPMGVGTTTPEPLPSPIPEPTTARSPGFAAALAISCLIGAGYLATRKGR